MGLLDDAIRDHLDLKRRHGADPAELERAEREALGPVRRKGDVATAGYDDDVDVDDEQFEIEDDDASAGSRSAAYDQAEDDWDYGPDDALAVDEPGVTDEPPGPEPPRRRSRRSAVEDDSETESDAEPDQPRGLAARFGLRGRRTEDDHSAEPEPEPEEPLGEDEPTRVHRTEGAGHTAAPAGGDTAEHDVEEPTHGDEGEESDEDVLEETPEFLQDTPDHDRLWFEQKPPRDFDFDG